MGQESSRGPKKVAQGVQKVPKGFQKVAKSHEKDIQKASTRHPNAISKCIGNSIGNSISNAIANAIATAKGNRSPRHGGGKAEGNWIPFYPFIIINIPLNNFHMRLGIFSFIYTYTVD